MRRYFLQKLLSLIPVLVGISLIAFILGVISPGDPAELALSQGGAEVTPERLAETREELGLNDPLYTQYFRWLAGAVHGNLGTSIKTKRPVSGELALRLPITLRLAAYSVSFACTFGLLVGILSAAWKDKPFDWIIKGLVNVMLSFPAFWLALLMILLFAETLGWLPTSGIGGLRHMLMPSLVLSCAVGAELARLVRASVVAEFGKQYYHAASARGIGKAALILRSALPNAILPTITMLGNYLGGILGGSVVVETLFALPGIGSYAIDAIYARDYTALQGYVLLTGFLFVAITSAVDIICMLFDPKIRLGGNG